MCGGRELFHVSLCPVFLLGHIKITGVSSFKEQDLIESVFGNGPKINKT